MQGKTLHPEPEARRHLSGNRVCQDLRITSGLPVIRHVGLPVRFPTVETLTTGILIQIASPVEPKPLHEGPNLFASRQSG